MRPHPTQTHMNPGAIVAGFTFTVLFLLGAWALALLTRPKPAPEPHYCFRADPPPCQMSVQP